MLQLCGKTERADHILGHSQRDDMESLGYSLLYLLQGSLPWSYPKRLANNHFILHLKKTTSIEKLCQNLPQEFTLYMKHVRSLGFADKPNYSYLRKIFRDLFHRSGFKYDRIFDWTIKRYVEEHQLRPCVVSGALPS
jgi:casein kinase I homolog HRR25